MVASKQRAERVNGWQGEVCKRCGRRNCVGFNVDDGTWSAVVRGLFTTLCTTCFDELAEESGISYIYEQVYAVSWSDWRDAA